MEVKDPTLTISMTVSMEDYVAYMIWKIERELTFSSSILEHSCHRYGGATRLADIQRSRGHLDRAESYIEEIKLLEDPG